jgi:hypothetical protein
VKEAPVCRITLPASFDNGAQTRAVTIGGTVYWGPKDSDPTKYEFKNGGESYLKTDMLIYEP